MFACKLIMSLNVSETKEPPLNEDIVVHIKCKFEPTVRVVAPILLHLAEGISIRKSINIDQQYQFIITSTVFIVNISETKHSC